MTEQLPTTRAFERRLRLGLGGLLVAIAFAALAGGWLYHFAKIEADDQRLADTLADVLSHSVHRVSFSGKYHAQLLVEDFVAANEDLEFVIIEETGVGTWAAAGEPRGDRVLVVTRPFRSGFPEEEIGVIRVGLSREHVDEAFERELLFVIGLAAITVGGGLVLLWGASRRLAAPVEEMGRELGGLLQHSPVAICVQGEGGRIERSSARFDELFGDGESAVGKRLRHLLDPQDNQLLRQEEQEMLRGTARVVRREGTLEIQGERRRFAFTRFALGDSKPQVVTLALDVTEQRRLEDSLIHSGRMESIGQFAGGVAHDFNNLLTGVAGATDLISLADGDRAIVEEQVGHLRELTTMAAELTGRLLSFGRKQITVVAPHDLNQLVRDVERLASRILREDVTFEMALSDDALPLRADRGQIDQIVINLLSNAEDASPAGGLLRLTTERRTLDVARVVGRERLEPGDYAVLAVADSGEGIPEEMRERLFEAFATSKGVGKGTGLGLSIVAGVVIRHGGGIEFDTSSDGTTFRVWLPLIDASALKAPVEAAPSTAAPRGEMRLLVIEDNAFVRDSVVAALRRSGHEVWEAADGEAGLEAFVAHEGELDAVLVDMIMPKLNGSEVCTAIRERAPTLPVLFMTGYDDEMLQDVMGSDPNISWVQKPFTLQQLSERLAEFLG